MAFAASPAQFDLTVGTVQVSLAAGSAWRADTDASRAFQAALVDLENSGGPPSPTWSELQEEGDCFFRQHYQQDPALLIGEAPLVRMGLPILKGLADRLGPHCLTERGLWVVPFASSAADLVSNVAAGSPALAGVRIAQFALAPVRNLIDFADDSDSAVALSNASMRREMASFGFTIAPFAVYLPDVAPLLSTLASQLTTLCVTDGGSFEVAGAVSAAGGTFPRVTTLAVGVLSRWDLVDALLKACPALELLVVVNALGCSTTYPTHGRTNTGITTSTAFRLGLAFQKHSLFPRTSPLPSHASLRRIALDSPEPAWQWGLTTPPIPLAAPLVVPARHPQLVAVHWLTGDRDETSLQVRLVSAVLPSDFSFLDGTVHVDLGPGNLELWQSLATVMSSDAT
ncbi:hypothetical protein Rhopal_006057-T1 [Rhodotorula paludigena]|uniref:Uncharacterized protein n=1 Tax=Rhodotorula paludigena TaxID=86838 RepID=A0AAV5GUI0_9BASI|nr:hypothetical protein Rhopal_006057-T1 [Rhodotorula paludigena]